MSDLAALRANVEAGAGLARNPLGDQVAALLRQQLMRGRLRPGAKLVEREVAELLGVSRAPVRDALIQLEQEGLVVSRTNGRFVVELDERQFRELYQIRLVLETLAAELAASRPGAAASAELHAKLADMADALAQADEDAFSRADMELHGLIWRHAGNERLASLLRSLLGPFFLYVASHAGIFDRTDDLQRHRDLVAHIEAGAVEAIRDSLRRDFAESQEALLHSLRAGALGAAAGEGA